MDKRAGLLALLVLVLSACGGAAPHAAHLHHKSQQVLFFTPSHRVGCELDLNLAHTATPAEAYCNSTDRAVTLLPSGRTSVSCESCVSNDVGSTLGYGSSVSLGPFRCTALHAGALCVIEKTGRGFLIGRKGVPELIRGR